ncbi:hypothetical protein [Mycoplasmopsis alligatoris]|uniref:Uncharacterized protein n=1 Tax=Mycoplasmopsis alligatoris A21JP2 TaxID=747682 RepID=D4XWK3_9BACT|nr:hypothetical protein [Mycoplasmopsis alligatoris]EFF41350.1 conserved hypothetical protein [Mycoplasmopsis alligatoris A21JP2]
MINQFQTKSSQDLDLSFTFMITNFENRVFYISLGKMLRDIKYTQQYNEWFMEDLLFFLEKNKYQLRFDLEKIVLSNWENLNLSESNLKEFQEFLKTKITNFDLVIA